VEIMQKAAVTENQQIEAQSEEQQTSRQQTTPQQLQGHPDLNSHVPPENKQLECEKAEVIKMLIELANRACPNPVLNPAWSKWITDYFNYVFSRSADQRLLEIAKLRAEYNKSPETRLIELGGDILTKIFQEIG
jgi:hypothetical protein